MTEDREELNDAVGARKAVLRELLDHDGVPPDIITAVALLALGIQLHYDHAQDVERIAIILEQWADGIRHGQFIDRPITEPKGGRRGSK